MTRQQPVTIPENGIIDREALRAELEAVCRRFHLLVADITDAEWSSKTPMTAWTIGEVLTHVLTGVQQTPLMLRFLRRGKDFVNLPLWLINVGFAQPEPESLNQIKFCTGD